ncbi:MAG TPA: alpha/beta hydrolase-fold protein [Pseudonocardiaceae bacterium]|jgi:S-formylglutathione hydrolase FrmB|nr:alpha/beta hydrolase-fold protein [Pseudonocardiaceae bacterium]
MLPWEGELAGRLDRHTFESTLLRDNPLGDPHVRPLWVYVPPGYEDSGERYPSVYMIQGYTGQVTMWANRTPFRQPFIETADAVFANGSTPGCVIVYVDAWTVYGGSQFVDSTGTGKYHSYLCDEIVPWVDAHYRTIDDNQSRAIAGKSSGGFGAMITPMLRPDLFGALATHAGDNLYEMCYIPEFANAVRFLRKHDNDIMQWWDDFQSRIAFTQEGDQTLVMLLGLAACYSPAPDGTPEVPFDQVTGVLRAEQWQKWLDWDPVRMVERYAEQVRSWRAVWIDGGTKDEWYLDIGAQAFRAEVKKAGLPDDRVHFELFDAGHGGIDYRYPLSLAWLAERLAR